MNGTSSSRRPESNAQQERYRGSADGLEVWALVPARSGSKGVDDKNMRTVQGHSLIGLSVAAACATPGVSRVFVNSDSSRYMAEGIYYGAEAPFQRPKELASDEASDLEVIDHFLRWAIDSGWALPAAVVHLRPTTPIRDPLLIADAVAFALDESENATAVRSVHPASESPFKWFLKDSQGYLETMTGSRQLDGANASRQSFPIVYVPNGYVDVIFPSRVLKSGCLHGDAVLPFETPSVVEVDTMADLEILQAISTFPPMLQAGLRKNEGF